MHFSVHHIVSTSPTNDHWLNIVLGVAAILTSVALLGGGWLTWNYGRRASAFVTALATPVPDGGFLITVRPVVRAVGVFRVMFQEQTGATVSVTEMWWDPVSQQLREGREWSQTQAFGQQHVEPGEELGTTTLLHAFTPSPHVLGWSIAFGVDARRKWWLPRSSAAWTDRVFVPLPKNLDSGSVDE